MQIDSNHSPIAWRSEPAMIVFYFYNPFLDLRQRKESLHETVAERTDKRQRTERNQPV